MLVVGDEAPDFVVGSGSLHRILHERGAIVFFFPKAFTAGWTREAGGFRREYATFQKAGFEVIGVSHDTQETCDRFRAALELPYPMVGDPDGRILRAYGVRWPILGVARRVSYAVGRDRRIQRALHSEFDADAHVKGACLFIHRPPLLTSPT